MHLQTEREGRRYDVVSMMSELTSNAAVERETRAAVTREFQVRNVCSA